MDFLTIIFGIVSIVCIILGASRQYKHYVKRNLENFEEVDGHVSDYEVDYSTDSDGNRTIQYTSIIEYEVNSVKYTIKSNHSSNSKQKLGKLVAIKYNPENPEDAIFKNDYTGLIILIAGIVFLMATIYMCINNLSALEESQEIVEHMSNM